MIAKELDARGMRTASTVLVGLALLVGALGLLAPPAAADHVYSHQYIVQGRIATEDGDPVDAANVTVELAGWESHGGASGLCPQDPSGDHHEVQSAEQAGVYTLRTDELGDYRLCLHAHDLGDGSRVVVSAGNVSRTVETNTAQRTSYVSFTIPPGSTGRVGSQAFHETVVFRGRLWQPLAEGERLEGVEVTGVSVTDHPMNVTLDTGNGSVTEVRVTTDSQYGAFEAVFNEAGELVEGAQIESRVVVDGNVSVQTFQLDPALRAVYTEVVLPWEIRSEDPGPPTIFEAVPRFGEAAQTPQGTVALSSPREGSVELSTRLSDSLVRNLRSQLDANGDGTLSEAEIASVTAQPVSVELSPGVQLDGEPATLSEPITSFVGLEAEAGNTSEVRWILSGDLVLPEPSGDPFELRIDPTDRGFDLTVLAPPDHEIDGVVNGTASDACTAVAPGARAPLELSLRSAQGACGAGERTDPPSTADIDGGDGDEGKPSPGVGAVLVVLAGLVALAGHRSRRG